MKQGPEENPGRFEASVFGDADNVSPNVSLVSFNFVESNIKCNT